MEPKEDLLTEYGHKMGPLVDELDTPETWSSKAESIKRKIAPYFGEASIEAVPPLDPEIGEPVQKDGYTQRRVTYQTEPGERIPAFLQIPDTLSGKAPVVLCFHGTNPEGKSEMIGSMKNLNYGSELAQRGFITLAPDQWGHGERRVNKKGHHMQTAKLYEKHPHWSLEGKTVWDHQRALDFIATLDEADLTNIGATGHSRGGRAVTNIMFFDLRVKCGVPSCGTIANYGEDKMAKTKAHLNAGLNLAPKYYQAFVDGTVPDYDIHELLALIAPRPLLLLSPFVDQFSDNYTLISVAAERVSKVYRTLGAGQNFSRFSHGEGHHTGPIVRAAAYAWLEYHLKEQVTGLTGTNIGYLAPGIKEANEKRFIDEVSDFNWKEV